MLKKIQEKGRILVLDKQNTGLPLNVYLGLIGLKHLLMDTIDISIFRKRKMSNNELTLHRLFPLGHLILYKKK